MSQSRDQQKAHRQSLQHKGICVDCRNTPAKEGRTLCQKCLTARSTRYYANKAIRDKFIEEQPCIVERKMEIADRLYRLRRSA